MVQAESMSCKGFHLFEECTISPSPSYAEDNNQGMVAVLESTEEEKSVSGQIPVAVWPSWASTTFGHPIPSGGFGLLSTGDASCHF